MDGNRQVNKVFSFFQVLLVALAAASSPAQALLKGGTWQELNTSTDPINGTIPQADGATIPIYQGSHLLPPGEVHSVNYTAMPRDFSASALPSQMQVVNPSDTEGDLFAQSPTPIVSWEGNQLPTVGLLWADAATPDTPLSPQPAINQTFCAQNLSGRQLVVWPQEDDSVAVPALFLSTLTGEPNSSAIPLLNPKVTINIQAAEDNPVSVSADHIDEAFKASKVKVGESITLTVTTTGCDGKIFANGSFVIRRDDAKNRQGEVNNSEPVHVGDTELTTTATEYHGTTDDTGKATVVVTQAKGPGVKTRLIVSAVNYPTLHAEANVIFTTLTSPDTDLANMYGHMIDSTTADLNGITYTFTRPKLAAEIGGTRDTVNGINETWAQFNWSKADNHCDILPAAEQLVAMRNAHDTLDTYTGWPLTGNAEYWSSTKDQLDSYHYTVQMISGSVVRESSGSSFLVSCVDKALPAAHPQITLSPEGPYEAEVGDSIDLVMSVVDRDTKKPLPYRYMELFVDPASNRQGVHKDEWDNLRVTISSEDMRASSPEHYTGVTDANGQAHLTLHHNHGVGVQTPIRIVMPDDERGSVELPFSVIFTVITSPDVAVANMWGHMRGVVDAGNLYKRPPLKAEASSASGGQSENNEEWATFDTVTAATGQCGTGQVPDSGSLTHLYGEHPNNEMLTEHGWPTGLHAYIDADSGAVLPPANVNLENGNPGTGSANYLTCSANEMVAQLDAYFNDDPTQNGLAVAKVGEQIILNVHSRNALNQQSIPNADFTVTLAPGKQRDGLTTGFTDPTNGQLFFDGVAYSVAQTAVYHGITDNHGDARIVLTQPKGVGILTPLTVEPAESLLNLPLSRSVKFTVATSPDTANANMWGHMADTITVGDLTFERPKLASEVSANTSPKTQLEANETWARVSHADAAGNTDAGGCAVNRLPHIDQLEALYNDNSGGAIKSIHGWPTLINYWSSTYQTASTWKLIALSTGSEFAGGTSTIYTSCLTTDNPVAASITIEPVDSSLWYDGNGEHAVKVKKGDTLQLKVTVKDASGNPVPEAPFVFTRGDGYTRQNEKHTASEGNDLEHLVTPVVIDGESIAWTTTKMGAVTGADGTKTISVTRPDTNGTKTAVIATLYDNASVSASIDTVFTVVTSPDVSVAVMWGHMPDTLTGQDGVVYHRPLLENELQSRTNMVHYLEDHEYWAAFYGPGTTKTNPDNCASGYHPTLTALDALYNAYPNGSIKSVQGWPVIRSYWSGGMGTTGNPIATGKPTQYYIVDLNDDSRRLISNSSINDTQYQICSANSSLATQIVLSSSLAQDADVKAIKVTSSEMIPTVITTTDVQGNPVGNAPFMLTRDAGTARNTSYKPESSSVLNLLSDGRGVDWTWNTTKGSSYPYYGVTGSNGTFVMGVTSSDAPGVKNVITASLYQGSTVASSLPVIFTTITSPNNVLANMWGHMPETFSASNGAEFKRPQLRNEEGASSDTSYIIANNESWLSLKVSLVKSQGIGACGLNQMPLLADLASLYADHPNGKLEMDLGMPLTVTGSSKPRWWSGDSLLVNQSVNYQYVDMKSGDSGYNGGNENYFQICLTAPRQLSMTLSSTAWNADKSAADVKKGESMPMAVTVINAAGQPQKGVVVQITREKSYSRGKIYGTNAPAFPWVIGPAESSTSSSTYMTLTPVSPAGTATAFNSSSGKWLAMTGDDGTLQFTLNQDKSLGWKTAITAALVDQPTMTASQDAIFTIETSPDSPNATYWGHLPDTVALNGKTFHRPALRTELAVVGPSYLYTDNEYWTKVRYKDSGHNESALNYLCGMENVATLDDLKALQGVIGKLHWPTSSSSSNDYLSQTLAEDGTGYYSFNETTGVRSTKPDNPASFGFGICLAQ